MADCWTASIDELANGQWHWVCFGSFGDRDFHVEGMEDSRLVANAKSLLVVMDSITSKIGSSNG